MRIDLRERVVGKHQFDIKNNPIQKRRARSGGKLISFKVGQRGHHRPHTTSGLHYPHWHMA